MKTILCFGDSNTYGLKSDGTGRYDFTVRFPGRLQTILGSGCHVIEEGCPGRTTVFEDENRPYKKGIDYISPCLNSYNPIDYVVVMLGTNDCKSAFGATSKQIASGLSALIARIKEEAVPSPKILIVSPIHLGDSMGKPDYDPEFNQTSVATAKGLADEYRLLAQKTGCDFLDASTVAQASSMDQEHLDEIGHNNLAKAIAQIIAENLFQ
ncbi:MAG TPA: SGNH/GDSL hydrolase family protein [Oscillospiraceae bacterium]|nr:SGNH/GDSL hydrolase family protein [Oscillospiraceae bacterium]